MYKDKVKAGIQKFNFRERVGDDELGGATVEVSELLSDAVNKCGERKKFYSTKPKLSVDT